MKRSNLKTWYKLLLVSTSTIACPAWAQEVEPADPAVGQNEIIVTATKRSESLQDVPISIQVLGSERLDQNQVAGFDDYAKLLPSVSFQSYGPGQAQMFFRGISSGGDGGYGARTGSVPAAGFYVDETPLTTIGNTVDLHIYDIARVEALSGPQGTLFGASSLSGTLRLITNQPDLTSFSAGYDLQLNKFGKGDFGGVAEGFINLPLNERMALRVVGFFQRDGGYIDNLPASRTYTLSDNDPATELTVTNDEFAEQDYNSVETWGARAALKIDLNDSWTATPSIIYQNQKARGSFLYDPLAGDLATENFAPELNEDEWYQAALTITGELGNWDVVYSGGYFGREVNTQADYSDYTVAYDGIPGYTNFPDGAGGFLDPTQIFSGRDRYTKHSHEFRVTSPAEDRFRLLAGLFFQRQTDKVEANYEIPGLAGIPDTLAVATLGDDIFGTRVKRIDRDYAMFGEAAFDITPSLTLTAGIRGFIAKNTQVGFSGFASNAAATDCIPTTRTDLPCINVDAKFDGSGETHKVNLSWDIDPDRMIYATYSTGFRPGGSNRRPGVAPFQPDTLTNYEMGWKTAWFNRSLYINGAVFMQKWSDVQYGLSPVGSGGVINIYNAGNAEVKGIELDVTWRPAQGLTLSGAGTYIDAKLTTDFCSFDTNGNPDCTNGVVAAPRGTRLPVQPKLKLNGTARYEFPMGSLDSFVQASVNHQGGTRTWLTDREFAQLGPTRGFVTFDFSTGFKKDSWNVELFIQNAFDRRGQLSINTVCVPTICSFAPGVYPVKPQIFGVKVGQRF